MISASALSSRKHFLVRLYAGLGVANIAIWTATVIAFHHNVLLLGTAFLAYMLGLRHGVDADHIVAIDNVTRRLMQQGKRALTTGLFFSLGHSSVVFAASLAIAAWASPFILGNFRAAGAILGSGISALFLVVIAGANSVILVSLIRALRRADQASAENPATELVARGLIGHLLRRTFATIHAEWQMYPLGVLFGLGFDTASEIALLGISAASASQGLPLWTVLLFPALFMAGMTLIDTTDNVLMAGIYGWAFVNPSRKLYYNVAITATSILAAVATAVVELAGLIADKMGANGPAWAVAKSLNDNSAGFGAATVATFIIIWLVFFFFARRHSNRDCSAE